MEIRDAYDEVLKDIISNGPKMFLGTYDAKNGKHEFMYGICTVMEWIADRTEKNEAYDFVVTEFMKNMLESEKSALQKSAVVL